MKIVLTVHQFFPDFGAGTEVLTFDTAKELQRRGHDVLVWTGYPTGAPGQVDQYEYEGIPVMRYYYNPVEASADSNMMEVEYCNRQFGKIFSEFLNEQKPDMIHFFHLGRLSSTAIHAGFSQQIPMVFTATDFWFVCPSNQLRMPDNSLCLGPDKHGINCLRHVVSASQPESVQKKVESMPDWALALLVWGARQSWWPEKKYSPLVSSLTGRLSYQQDAMNRLDRVFVPTKLMQDTLLRYGLEKNRAVYLPYGINLRHVEHAPAKQPSNVLRLGFIGTLYEHKGPHVLLEAIKQLPSDAPLELKIYGKQNEFPDYVARLKELAGSDTRIQFCGTFPNHEIGNVFSELDVLVVPSIWYENTPLVVYSAQATRTPVIATNLGGMSEAVTHDQNGLLFEKGDAGGLAQQIQRLLDDKSLLERLSSQAKQPTSMPSYVDALEKSYQQILAEKRTTT